MSYMDYAEDCCPESTPRRNCYCLFRPCCLSRCLCGCRRPQCCCCTPKCPEVRPICQRPRCCCLCCLCRPILRCCCCCRRCPGPRPTPCRKDINGMQVQLQGMSGGTVVNNANVIFDTVLNDTSNHISYDNVTGVFTINKPGNYLVNWWVNTDGAESLTNVTFSAEVDGVSIASTSPSPMTTIQIYGQGFFTVDDVPVHLSLVNRTGADVNYGIAGIQADLVIIEL